MREIGLPQLIKINIKNFSLYKQQPTFSYEFKEGINAVLGINGIGKTTFIEMILYCLCGFSLNDSKAKVFKENLTYFYDRCDPKADNSQASVTLEYSIKNAKIIIERSLIEDKILSLLINGEVIVNDENVYNEIVVKMMQVTDFISAQKIIRTFLIFDEQRLNVAWEISSQDEILKILLLDEKTQTEIMELEKRVGTLDTKGRQGSEARRVIRERIAVIEEERKKVSDHLNVILNDNETQEISIDELIILKNRISNDVEGFRDKSDELKSSLDELEREYSRVVGERNEVKQQIEQVISEEERLEVNMYKSIYEKFPDYYFTIEKNLINTGECLTCGTKDKLLKKEFIQRKEEHCCIICGSEIEESIDFNKEDVEKMNELYSLKNDLFLFIDNKSLELEKIKVDMDYITDEVKKISNKISGNESSLVEIESRITENLPEKTPKDTYELMIRNLDKQAEELTIEVDKIYKERKKAEMKLKETQTEFLQFLSSLNIKISQYFNKYASTFLGVDCELTIRQQKKRYIPQIMFIPKIAGFERGSIYSVSESQRFFLDQAFRMAIIDFLSSEIEGFKTFFITETPEGSLDLAYEEQVAKMFRIFADSQNNIIFTSNLNSSNFLNQVFLGVTDSKSRILNMLEKGNPTKIQKNYKKIFEDKLEELVQVE